MKYFLIARVSREDQIEALPAQKKRLLEYVEKKGETDYEYFEYNETAHTIDARKEFGKIIEQIQKVTKKQKVIVVFDKIDRFTRDSSQDEVKLFKQLVAEDRIEIHFPHDNLYVTKDSPAADLFRLDIGMGLAAYYSNSISDNVKRRFEEMVTKGKYPHQAPYGYKHVNNGTRKNPDKNILIDEDKAQYVRKMFDLRRKGLSYDEIRNELYGAGMRSQTGGIISKNPVSQILANKFYIGIMKYRGVEYPHCYEHIIPDDVFYACQAVNDDRKHKPSKSKTKESYALGNRVATCGRCGRTISCYKKKGIVYLRCAGNKICRNPNCAEKLIESSILSVLASVKVDKEISEDIALLLKNRYASEISFRKQSKASIQKEYSSLEKKLEILYDDRLAGRITVSTYDKNAARIRSRKEELDEQITKLGDDSQDIIINTSYLLDLLGRMEELYKSSKPELKNKLLGFLFSNLEINNKNLTYKLNDPFKIIDDANKKHTDKRSMFLLAGPAGFEPANDGTKTRCLTTWRRPNL